MCSPAACSPPATATTRRAVRQIRDREQQRKAAAKAALAGKQRADKVAIARVATAFQKALSAASSDDPCRYVTAKVKQNVRGFDFGSGRPSCTNAIRGSDAESSKPVSKAPLGVATIKFGALPPLTVSFDSGPDGAVVTWRPSPIPTASSTTAGGRCSSRRAGAGSYTAAARDPRPSPAQVHTAPPVAPAKRVVLGERQRLGSARRQVVRDHADRLQPRQSLSAADLAAARCLGYAVVVCRSAAGRCTHARVDWPIGARPAADHGETRPNVAGVHRGHHRRWHRRSPRRRRRNDPPRRPARGNRRRHGDRAQSSAARAFRRPPRTGRTLTTTTFTSRASPRRSGSSTHSKLPASCGCADT